MSNARELAEVAGSYGSGGFTGMKNRIINGAMMIDQRNAGASVTIDSSATKFITDRFEAQITGAAVCTGQQSSTAPAGFINALLMTVTTPDTSLSGSDRNSIQQNIEGLNVADLGWGTANAQPVTLSFWVRSSLTGTFSGSLSNSANNRSYPYSYTISSANTWEQKTVTIAGDTTGTWLTTNGIGIRCYFSLGCSSTYLGSADAWAGAGYRGVTGETPVVGTSGATFYITGVQLEKGSTATSFDYRPYGTELALCQRYYQKSFPQGTAPAQAAGIAGAAGAVYCQGQAANAPAYAYVPLKVTMRAAPSTVTLYNPIAANANWRNATAGSDIYSNVGMANDSALYINANTQVLAQYQEGAIHYTASAEL